MSSPPPISPDQASFGPIPNYMVWAILITIASLCLCCGIGTIPGIVAIVFASQVNGKLAAGDRTGAERASKNARTWCWVTSILCILGLVASIAMIASGGQETYMEYLQELQQQQQVQAE